MAEEKKGIFQRLTEYSADAVAKTQENRERLAAQQRERNLVQTAKELDAASQHWSVPAVIRHYESNDKGDALFQSEVVVFAEHGYEPSMQTAEGSHLHAGRLLLTGGLSIFAGKRGIRSKGKLTVTFVRSVAPSTASSNEGIAEQIEQLASLRDKGILTSEEFEAKKQDLLSRL